MVLYMSFLCKEEGTLSSLIEADCTIMFLVDYFTEDGCNEVAKAVRAFDYAKTLTLSVGVLWALSNATIRLPKFRRLRKLKAGTTSCYCSSVQDFIQTVVSWCRGKMERLIYKVG